MQSGKKPPACIRFRTENLLWPELGSNSVVEADYTGVRGRKLLYGNPNLDADQLSPQYLSLGSQLDSEVPNPFFGIAPAQSQLGSQPTVAYNQLLRPYPQYTSLQWTRSLPGAASEFDALNLKYNHSFSSGLSLLTTYQWSKATNGPEDSLGWATGISGAMRTTPTSITTSAPTMFPKALRPLWFTISPTARVKDGDLRLPQLYERSQGTGRFPLRFALRADYLCIRCSTATQII